MPLTITYLGHLLPNHILSQTLTEWLAYNAELSSTLQASWQLLVIVGNENLYVNLIGGCNICSGKLQPVTTYLQVDQ